MTHQCSRSVPDHITGTWMPGIDQVRVLESLLPAALAKAYAAHGHPGAVGGGGRQYGGLILGGKKIIYVNGFPGGDTGFQTEVKQGQPVIVCDGGDSFFGVEYDPATKTFNNFAFNGYA